MWTVATYVLKQKFKGRKQYPLVLMLEPLFRCNLACAGCGKIQYPAHVLKMQLTFRGHDGGKSEGLRGQECPRYTFLTFSAASPGGSRRHHRALTGIEITILKPNRESVHWSAWRETSKT